MSNHLFTFILAGGSGERFWPLSRSKTPKHLLRLLTDRTLLETTVRRVENLVPWDQVFILTNAAQVDSIRKELPFLPAENIVAEPEKRDTGPACALAVGFARSRDKDAICTLLPADAVIHNTPVFQKQLAAAAEVAAKRDALITFAIPPSYPSTGFGYLQLGEAHDSVHKVVRFVEKPDLATAESYYRSGEYAWNAGMFLWRAEIFLREAERLAPPLAEFIRDFPQGDAKPYLAERFPKLPKISVDYAIMEKASEVLAMKAEFDWDDVGSWTALPDHLGRDEGGNTVRGDVVEHASRNNIALSNGRLIALCGVEDLIVIETPDALLVCHRDAAQDIKKLQPLLPEKVR
ncbi:MAG TPA: sugar phosphate nucleotidyltransferase [Terrimicrobiaceae bacterium]|nr:sugar phosphate nucleotidyltransferase [Terrimicrobiaceae bacterium]